MNTCNELLKVLLKRSMFFILPSPKTQCYINQLKKITISLKHRFVSTIYPLTEKLCITSTDSHLLLGLSTQPSTVYLQCVCVCEFVLYAHRNSRKVRWQTGCIFCAYQLASIYSQQSSVCTGVQRGVESVVPPHNPHQPNVLSPSVWQLTQSSRVRGQRSRHTHREMSHLD